MNCTKTPLYLLVLVLTAAVTVATLGGGLFGQSGPWFSQWQHESFRTLCHQMPHRSFWIGGQPMAVCSRCFGIYAGFLAGWLLLPVMGYGGIGRRASTPFSQLLAGMVIINLADIVGNMLGFWENTLVTRSILGWGLGMCAAVLFSGTFFTQSQKNYKEDYYGRINTSGAGR